MPRAADGGAGFLDDVAGALASLVRRQPWPWAIGFVVLAWATLSVRLDPVRLAIVVAATCLASGLVASALGPLPSLRRWLRHAIFLASVAIVLLTWTQGMGSSASPWGVLLAVVIVGWGSRSRVALGCAAALTASALARHLLDGPVVWPRHDDRALAANAAGLVGLTFAARRGRPRGWWIVAAGTAFWAAVAHWFALRLRSPTLTDYTWGTTGLLAAAPSVVLAAVAARAATLLREPPREDAAGILVVSVQRRPWATSLAAAAAGCAVLHTAWLDGDGNARIVLVVGMAALWQCAWTSESGFDLLGPCLVATLLSFPVAQGICVGLKLFDPESVLWASAALFLPLLCGLATSGARTTAFPWWGWAACAALVAAQFPAGSLPIRWTIACSAAALTAHAFIVSQVRAWPFLVAGPLAAAMLSTDALGGPFRHSRSVMMLVGSEPEALLVAGPVAVLLALAARRVRSMTAVPAGHPSRELASIRDRAVPAASAAS